jgi:hypothetical protein
MDLPLIDHTPSPSGNPPTEGAPLGAQSFKTVLKLTAAAALEAAATSSDRAAEATAAEAEAADDDYPSVCPDCKLIDCCWGEQCPECGRHYHSYCHNAICECDEPCECTPKTKTTDGSTTTGCTEQTQEATRCSMGCAQNRLDGNIQTCWWCNFCLIENLIDSFYICIKRINDREGAANAPTDKNKMKMIKVFMRYLDKYAQPVEYEYRTRYGEIRTEWKVQLSLDPINRTKPFECDKLPGISFFGQLHLFLAKNYPATVEFEDGDERGIIREFLDNNAGVSAELVRLAAF